MKYLVIIILLFTGLNSVAQQSQGNDTGKYVHYKFQYGSRMPRYQADSVLNPPRDTVYSKTGIARKGNNFYVGNGSYWTLVSSTSITYTGIDSVVIRGTNLCQWSGGISTCYTITGGTGGTFTGVDSVTVNGNNLCQWKSGIQTCYTVTNTIINNTNIVNNITNIVDSSTTIFSTGSGIVNSYTDGYTTCYVFSSGDTICYDQRKYYDSTSLNYDTTLYIHWNHGIAVDSITIGYSDVDSGDSCIIILYDPVSQKTLWYLNPNCRGNGGGGGGINIYNSDSSLLSDRTVNLNGHNLTFSDVSSLTVPLFNMNSINTYLGYDNLPLGISFNTVDTGIFLNGRHSFLNYNVPSGSLTDSLLTWNPTTKEVRMVNSNSYTPTLYSGDGSINASGTGSIRTVKITGVSEDAVLNFTAGNTSSGDSTWTYQGSEGILFASIKTLALGESIGGQAQFQLTYASSGSFGINSKYSPDYPTGYNLNSALNFDTTYGFTFSEGGTIKKGIRYTYGGYDSTQWDYNTLVTKGYVDSHSGGGSVTSVATGLGLTGGTITTTGTIRLDTANASVISRQRAAATYQPIGSYLTASNFVDNEIPSGTVNSSNVTFTLANTPTSGSVHVYVSGVRQKLTTHYSISGSTITFVTAPTTGSDIIVDYRK